uniref:DUF1279 domain-containing protein n=1 Tax=Panagrolaimus davidi TaxID=227884 RepID=A0A914P7Z7_9BILA
MLAQRCVHLLRHSNIQQTAAATYYSFLYSKSLILDKNNGTVFNNYNSNVRWLSTNSNSDDPSNDLDKKKGFLRSMKNFNITMTPEQKETKQIEIAKQKAEEKPEGLFAKVKFYFKRYWYIAIPVHIVSSALWFGALFLVVRSGIDVIAVLKVLHMPEVVITKVQNVPEAAGELVVALILYKITVPLHYLTTLAGIQLTFHVLRRMGKLKSAKEMEYGIRTKYEKYAQVIRRLNERRMAAVQHQFKPSTSSSLNRRKSHKKES